ncbi:hypothetical protein [Rufibacter quisquiliarum]|uniref:Uncharacterized protein n=1 Tax=Rufibacter quisquiliarum TaxID=1549639 RepID=A0A839GAX5_9BACT|nr:hypothetical protein [Rufibacter quisquiliarum]MBA9076694.1 hypothetical protein [Rufibacter quisquiliarum]
MQAQEFYSSEIANSKGKTGSENKKKTKRVYPNVMPQWQKAKIVEDMRYHVVEVPVKMEKSLAFKLEGSTVKPNGNSKLLVLKDKRTGELIAALMHAYSTTGVELTKIEYKTKPKDFSGLIFYTTLEGVFVNGYSYEKGKLVASVKESVIEQKQSARSYCNDYGYVRYGRELVQSD